MEKPMEFVAWPKTPRLFWDCTITEKIDGTNGCVIIEPARRVVENDLKPWAIPASTITCVGDGDTLFCVGAQSRNRLITPEADNAGFAAWVRDNAEGLFAALGPGRHFGEWWGHGIQRGYGLAAGDRRFSLFNTSRYNGMLLAEAVPGLDVVPVLGIRTFNTGYVEDWLDHLAGTGSRAAPGYHFPEGVCVYHTASGQVFKALIENDDQPKALVAA